MRVKQNNKTRTSTRAHTRTRAHLAWLKLLSAQSSELAKRCQRLRRRLLSFHQEKGGSGDSLRQRRWWGQRTGHPSRHHPVHHRHRRHRHRRHRLRHRHWTLDRCQSRLRQHRSRGHLCHRCHRALDHRQRRFRHHPRLATRWMGRNWQRRCLILAWDGQRSLRSLFKNMRQLGAGRHQDQRQQQGHRRHHRLRILWAQGCWSRWRQRKSASRSSS